VGSEVDIRVVWVFHNPISGFTEPTGCTIAVCDVGELITSRQRLAGMFCWGSIAVESCVMAVVLVLTWVDGCSC
jgi:hypothetical protein